jgi:hypothetical protein
MRRPPLSLIALLTARRETRAESARAAAAARPRRRGAP